MLQAKIQFLASLYSLAAGLEKSTRPLVFTSASGCRASENLDDFLGKLSFFPYMPIIFVMQGKCLFKDISRPEQAVLDMTLLQMLKTGFLVSTPKYIYYISRVQKTES